MSERRYQYRDEDLSFYLQVYKDYQDAVACLSSLRQHFKDSRVVMISDGDDDSRFFELAERFGVEYSLGDRLYTAENGGKMVQRMLAAFFERSSDYLIKIDTDSRIHRRFKYLIEGPVLFGTLEWKTAGSTEKLDFPNIQGGFVGYTRLAAEKIFCSQILLSPDLLDHRRSYADTIDIIRRVEKEGLISTDFVVRYACRQLHIPMIAFDEVYSIWRGKIASDGEGFAVTHPHKTSRPPFYWRGLINSVNPWRGFRQLMKTLKSTK